MATAKATRRTAPRKRPRQERSEATVDAILEAAAQELASEGYEATSTNRIAKAAGTSVGSLYQYFPSKDAIAVELVRRYREDRIAFVRSQLESVGEQPLESVVRALFSSLLQADGIRPELYRVLIDQVIRTNARREFKGYEEKLEAVVADAISRVKPPPPATRGSRPSCSCAWCSPSFTRRTRTSTATAPRRSRTSSRSSSSAISARSDARRARRRRVRCWSSMAGDAGDTRRLPAVL